MRLIALSCLVTAALAVCPVVADVVVLKEGVEVIPSNLLDATFSSVTAADIVNVVVDDTAFHDNTAANVGYGDAITFDGHDDTLFKFDLSTLPGLMGGTIHKAQLQLRQVSGNSGGSTALILTHNWTEALATRFSPVGSATLEWGPASDAKYSSADYGTLSPMAIGPFETTEYGIYNAWMVGDVTDDVQDLAAGALPNYGWEVRNANRVIFTSEHDADEYRPALFIDYTPAAPPAAITDLAVDGVDWGLVTLTWTAPVDDNASPYVYDIRYAEVSITEANWDAATQVADEPTPAEPDQSESFSVTGLSPETTYYFAIKTIDNGALVSDLSNVVSDTTLAMDVAEPDGVTDLEIVTIRPNLVTIRFTATGDDAGTGTASVYDVRFSESAIVTDVDFAAATEAIGEPAPSVAGTVEQFDVTGLDVLTPYYFAVKVGDEVPNWSVLSNVVAATTDEDLVAPDVITDLQFLGAQSSVAYLRWTAPADTGSADMGTYDIRYATEAITEANWDAATPVTGEPVPAAAGLLEEFIVTGLTPETEYYFAMTTADLAQPPNVSGLSNVVSGTTTQAVQPVVIVNPWIVNDRVADCRTIDTIGETFYKDYTPNGVVEPTTNEQRAINAYNNHKRRYYHWAEQPPNDNNLIQNLNVFGWALCGRHADGANSILTAIEAYGSFGLSVRKIALPGHWIYESGYGGTWHAMDTMTTMYVYDRATPRKIASCEQIKQDASLMLTAVAEGRACPGYLLCGDTPEWFNTVMQSYSTGPGGATTVYPMDMTLALGETLDRTWESWDGQWPLTSSGPPYHHEASRDWKDTVNFPYWEPYAVYGLDGYSVTYRRWANGTINIQPDFSQSGWEAAVASSSNIATMSEDGMTPHLHVASVGTPAEVVFHITTPFYLTSGAFSGSFVRASANDMTRVRTSADGVNWTTVWDNGLTGTTAVEDQTVGTSVRGKSEFWVKVELQADGAITDAGVSDFALSLVFDHNKGAMAYLDKGVNNITVTLDNPEDLVGSGAALYVRYTWKEYDGADWTIAREHEEQVTNSPYTFQIVTAGTKVPRTESIVMEVLPSVPDFAAPAAIGDLAVGNVDSTQLDLTWTAPGDDGVVGRARAYDIRYAESPITEANWDSATVVSNPPLPLPAGEAEQFTVTGLSPSTLYYFAITSSDEVPNESALSNVPSATTNAPDVTAPATTSDLVAQTSTESGSVELTWIAPGDDGTAGTAASYDIRYQPIAAGPISEANWASATSVAGVPSPQAAGASESLLVTGLALGQQYYFALKTSDEVPNESALSNVALAKAASLGEVILQQGLNGYTGVQDTYMEAGTPTTPRGDYERMRVCGYADYGPENVQRAAVAFDLSSIPADTQITSATLWVYSYNPPQVKGSTGEYGLYRLTRAWSASSCTWNSPWTTPGGDFEATPDTTAPKQPATAAPCWYSFDVTTRVQQWIADGSGNYGWVIKCTNEFLHNQDEFYQSDTANAEYRPKLVVSDLGAPAKPMLVSSDPAMDSTFAKVQNNVIALTFDLPVTLGVGQVLHVEPIAGGADVGGAFVGTVQPDGVTVKAVETGALMTHQVWYRITPAEALDVEPFTLDICALIGDANADGRVMAVDLGVIWSHNGQITDARYDINGDGRVMAVDLGVAWSRNGAVVPAK